MGAPPLPALTREECAQFKRDGVLIKERVLDPELCRRAVDLDIADVRDGVSACAKHTKEKENSPTNRLRIDCSVQL